MFCIDREYCLELQEIFNAIGIIYVQIDAELERVLYSIRRPVRHEWSREKARAVKALSSKEWYKGG